MTQYLQTNFDLNSGSLVGVLDELPLWSAPFGLKLLENIKYRKNISALDIGFGTGFPLTELAMRLGKSCKIYGIDPWKTAIDRASQKIGLYGIENIEIIQGIAENIPLESSSIDLIISNNGLNNVSDINKALNECSRVIKPGGQFIQTINLDKTMIEFYNVMAEVLLELKMDDCLDTMKAHIYKKRKPLEEYTKLLENHGFIIESVKQDQFAYRFVDGTSMLNHFFIRFAFLDPWKEIIPPERQNEVFGLIENKINDQVKPDDIFKLSVPYAVISCIKK